MSRSHRGELYWKIAPSNKGDCPRNGLPFWQVIAPFMLGRCREFRQRLESELFLDSSLGGYAFVSGGGMRYVSFGSARPTGEQTRWIRERVYDLLPGEVKDSLPLEIHRKYGPRRRVFGNVA